LSPKAGKLSTKTCLFSFSFHLSFFFCIESENNIQSIRQSCANTIQVLNQELFDIKTQCQEYEKINKQLIIENESLDDRSIVVGHQSTIDKYTQYKPLEQNHIAIETNPLIYQNNQTQIENQLLANNTDGQYHLINVSRHQTGHYECRASNGVNEHVVSKDIELRVLCKYTSVLNT